MSGYQRRADGLYVESDLVSRWYWTPSGILGSSDDVAVKFAMTIQKEATDGKS